MSDPKILFLLAGIGSGGIAKGLIPLVRELQKEHNVDLVVGTGKNAKFDLLTNPLPKTTIISQNKGFSDMSIIEKIQFINKLIKIFYVNQYDICVCSGAYVRFLGPIFSTIFNFRVILSEPVSFDPKMHSKNWLEYQLNLFKGWLRFKLSDVIAPISNTIGEEIVTLTNTPIKKIEILYYYYDLKKISNSAKLPLEVNKPDNPPFTIITVGRLVERKGVSELISVVSEIIEKNPRIQLFIVGDGPQKEFLQNQIKSLNKSRNIFLVGYQENPYQIMRNADLFVLNSKFEGSPTVLIEAMALEIPIVASDCPSGVRELLSHNGKLVGNLYEVNDLDALKEYIELHVSGSNSEEAARRIKLGKQKVNTLAPSHVLQMWNAVFKDIYR